MDHFSSGQSFSKFTALASLPDDHPALKQLQELLDEDDDFCSNWRDLYRACELKPGAEEKAACHAGGPSYCILKAWKRQSGSLATIGRLIELLTDIKRLDAVDMITEQFGLKNEETIKDHSWSGGHMSTAAPSSVPPTVFSWPTSAPQSMPTLPGPPVLPSRMIQIKSNHHSPVSSGSKHTSSATSVHLPLVSGDSNSKDHQAMDWSSKGDDAGGAGGELVVQCPPSGAETNYPSSTPSWTKEEYIQMLKLTESDMKPFKCDHCEQHFTYRTALHSHILHCHPEAAASLKNDLSLMKKDSGFVCNVCGHKFNKALRLEFHMRTHTGERPYVCSTCKKPFRRPDHLKAHMAIHVKTKPHVCVYCKRTFAWSSSLVSHIRAIHNPHPSYDGEEGDQKSYYKCHVKGCGKIFAWPCKLKRHIQTHSVDAKSKEFTCPSCDKSFTRESSLKAHKAKIHGPGHMLKCATCDRRFSSQAVWESHMKKQHPIILSSEKAVASATLMSQDKDHTLESNHPGTVDKTRVLEDTGNEDGNNSTVSTPVFTPISAGHPQQAFLKLSHKETVPLAHPNGEQLSSPVHSVSTASVTIRSLPQLIHAMAAAANVGTDTSTEKGNDSTMSSPLYSTVSVGHPQQALLNSSHKETVPLTHPHPTTDQLNSPVQIISTPPAGGIIKQLVHATKVATTTPGVLRFIPTSPNATSQTSIQRPSVNSSCSQLNQFTVLPHAS